MYHRGETVQPAGPSPAGLPEPVEYYVEASGLRSKTFKLDVIDLPGIKHIKVTYHFPSWLGSKDAVEDPSGDLRIPLEEGEVC